MSISIPTSRPSQRSGDTRKPLIPLIRSPQRYPDKGAPTPHHDRRGIVEDLRLTKSLAMGYDLLEGEHVVWRCFIGLCTPYLETPTAESKTQKKRKREPGRCMELWYVQETPRLESSARQSLSGCEKSAVSGHPISLPQDCTSDQHNHRQPNLLPPSSQHRGHHRLIHIARPRQDSAEPLLVSGMGNEEPQSSFAVKKSRYTNFESIELPSEDDGTDRSSQVPSNNSAHSFRATASSRMEIDNSSTDGDRSSQSKRSSEVSDSGSGEPRGNYSNKLEALIKDDVLRADPEVAEIFFQSVNGLLECASPDDIGVAEEIGEVSLLHLLELEAFGLVQQTGAMTTCAPSSTSNASSSSKGSSSSASRQSQGERSASSGGSGDGSARLPASNGGERGSYQPVNPKRNNPKAGSSESNHIRRFRCIHNALLPEVFCVNALTQERFRPCMGPGWTSMQHLKEHMQSHHTKQAKKPNPLRCNRCQDDLSSEEDLKAHELNVDCPIRCLDCREEFDTKAQRQQHQKRSHPEDANEPAFMELDESLWKIVKEKLKAYTDTVKRGKGCIDRELEQWVQTNTVEYEIGRSSKAKGNSKLELGQWYIIFKVLAKGEEVSKHPFYDYGIPSSEFAEERILLIHDRMIDARIEAHGPPPHQLEQQRAWYREALQSTIQVAAKTIIKPGAELRPNDMSPQLSEPRPTPPQELEYGLESTLSPVPPILPVDSNPLGMAPASSDFIPDSQQCVEAMADPGTPGMNIQITSSLQDISSPTDEGIYGYFGAPFQHYSQPQFPPDEPDFLGYDNSWDRWGSQSGSS